MNKEADVPKVRTRTPLPDSGYLIVRGIEPVDADARYMAQRFKKRYPGWNVYGLSAYYAPTSDEIDALCGEQLRPWADIAVFHIDDLYKVGLRVSPTFRTPHVTITHPDLDQLMELLRTALHTTRQNPYHEE